jgi:Bardet-Biedl syndrome 9 protein
MSIFQIKELWAARVGSSEEFHRASVCMGNIDNAQSPPDPSKIAVGSFQGYLRVYHA